MTLSLFDYKIINMSSKGDRKLTYIIFILEIEICLI